MHWIPLRIGPLIKRELAQVVFETNWVWIFRINLGWALFVSHGFGPMTWLNGQGLHWTRSLAPGVIASSPSISSVWLYGKYVRFFSRENVSFGGCPGVHFEIFVLIFSSSYLFQRGFFHRRSDDFAHFPRFCLFLEKIVEFAGKLLRFLNFSAYVFWVNIWILVPRYI